jgi:hypothetical protein
LSLLLALSGAVILIVVVFTVVLVVYVRHDRRRRRPPATTVEVVPDPESSEPAEVADAAAEFVQLWMDNEWEQRFG